MIKVGNYQVQMLAEGNPDIRFGFHRPPRNSVFHLHLHVMTLPLYDPKHEITYGHHITPVEEVK